MAPTVTEIAAPASWSTNRAFSVYVDNDGIHGWIFQCAGTGFAKVKLSDGSIVTEGKIWSGVGAPLDSRDNLETNPDCSVCFSQERGFYYVQYGDQQDDGNLMKLQTGVEPQLSATVTTSGGVAFWQFAAPITWQFGDFFVASGFSDTALNGVFKIGTFVNDDESGMNNSPTGRTFETNYAGGVNHTVTGTVSREIIPGMQTLMTSANETFGSPLLNGGPFHAPQKSVVDNNYYFINPREGEMFLVDVPEVVVPASGTNPNAVSMTYLGNARVGQNVSDPDFFATAIITFIDNAGTVWLISQDTTNVYFRKWTPGDGFTVNTWNSTYIGAVDVLTLHGGNGFYTASFLNATYVPAIDAVLLADAATGGTGDFNYAGDISWTGNLANIKLSDLSNPSFAQDNGTNFFTAAGDMKAASFSYFDYMPQASGSIGLQGDVMTSAQVGGILNVFNPTNLSLQNTYNITSLINAAGGSITAVPTKAATSYEVSHYGSGATLIPVPFASMQYHADTFGSSGVLVSYESTPETHATTNGSRVYWIQLTVAVIPKQPVVFVSVC